MGSVGAVSVDALGAAPKEKGTVADGAAAAGAGAAASFFGAPKLKLGADAAAGGAVGSGTFAGGATVLPKSKLYAGFGSLFGSEVTGRTSAVEAEAEDGASGTVDAVFVLDGCPNPKENFGADEPVELVANADVVGPPIGSGAGFGVVPKEKG